MASAVAGWSVLTAVSLAMGSFVGVVVHRLPACENIALARSRCDACGAGIAARDLVPLASWLVLRGRCRHCGAPIGWFYPAIELGAVAVAASAALTMSGWLLAASCLMGWALLALAVIDAQTFLLPDVLTLPLIPGGLVVAWLVDPSALTDHAVGAAAGFTVFALVAYLYRRWRGRDGLGRGDGKLMAGLGAWVGWSGVPDVILLAALGGLAVALVRQAFGARSANSEMIPFGPYLAAAGWLVWLHGPLFFG